MDTIRKRSVEGQIESIRANTGHAVLRSSPKPTKMSCKGPTDERTVGMTGVKTCNGQQQQQYQQQQQQQQQQHQLQRRRQQQRQ